jgi:hypothetical protein
MMMEENLMKMTMMITMMKKKMKMKTMTMMMITNKKLAKVQIKKI